MVKFEGSDKVREILVKEYFVKLQLLLFLIFYLDFFFFLPVCPCYWPIYLVCTLSIVYSSSSSSSSLHGIIARSTLIPGVSRPFELVDKKGADLFLVLKVRTIPKLGYLHISLFFFLIVPITESLSPSL